VDPGQQLDKVPAVGMGWTNCLDEDQVCGFVTRSVDKGM